MSEVKTNKITSLASNNDITLAPDGTGAIKIGDSTELVFGDGSDFKISHNGSKTKLEDTGTGNLEIRGTNIEFYSGDGGETLAKLTDDGAAELYHNNTKRIETTSTGATITGDATFTDSDATTIIDRVGTNVAGIKTGSGDDFCVGTADYTQAIRIKNNSGRIGINQTGPATTLDVNGTLTVTTTAGRGLTIKSAQGGSGQNDADAVYDAQDTEGGGGGFHKFFVGGNEKARIENDGDIKNVNNSYGAISDQRMKENIVDAASQWDDIKAVQVRKFNMIGSDTTQIGVIAQELEAANMSGLVSEAGFTDDKLNPDGELRKTVKYSVLYMKAIGALQEAIAKIETLETRLAALEAAE